MAERDVIMEGVIPISIEDRGVAGSMERITAEVNAKLKELDRKSATISIKGNLDDLKRSIKETETELAKLNAEEKTLSELVGSTKYHNAEATKARLAALKAEKVALEDNRKLMSSTLDGAQKQYDSNVRTLQQMDVWKAKQAELQRAKDAEARADAKYAADRAAAGREDARRTADQEAAIRRRALLELQASRENAARDKVAADAENRRLLNAIELQRKVNALNDEYVKQQKEIERLRSLPRSARDQRSEQVQIRTDTTRAFLEMAKIEEEARLLGRPIKIDVKVNDRAALQGVQAWRRDVTGWGNDLKGFGAKFIGWGKDSGNTIDRLSVAMQGLGQKLKGIFTAGGGGGARVNILGISTSFKTLFGVLTLGAPVITGLAGGIGSLISAMGAGIAGAAGVGAAGMSGFLMTAAGIKAAASNSVQALSTFKSALSTYQTAQLQYGPPGMKPLTPSQQASAGARSAAIPADQLRVQVDTMKLDTANRNYGQGSIQAAQASIALAGAQQTLSRAQTGTSGTANKTQLALNKLNSIIKQSPPQMRAAERAWLNLSSTWASLTQNVAQHDLGKILSDTFKAANSNVKWYAAATNAAFNSLQIGWGKWMKDLQSPAAKRVLENVMGNFVKSMPSIMDGIGHLVGAIGRMISQFSNYLPSLSKGFDAWATGIDNASRKTDGFKGGVASMVGAMRDLGHFLEAGAKWLITFFSAGVGPGVGLIDSMTRALNRSNEAMKTTEKSNIKDFFSQGAKTLSEFVSVIAPLISLLFKFGMAMGPVLNVTLSLTDAFIKFTEAVAKDPLVQIGVGGLAAVAIIGRLTKGLRDAGVASYTFGKNLITALKGMPNKGPVQAFKDAFAGSKDPMQITSSAEAGAAAMRSAIIEGGKVAAAEMRSGTAAGGTVAAAEERAGVASGGAVAAGESRLATPGGVLPKGVSAASPAAAGAEAGAVGTAAEVGGAGALGAGGGAAAAGASIGVLPIAVGLGAAYVGIHALSKAINGDGGVNASLTTMKNKMRDAIAAGDIGKLKALENAANTMGHKLNDVGIAGGGAFIKLSSTIASATAQMNANIGLLTTKNAAKVGPVFSDMAAQAGKSLSDIELSVKIGSATIPVLLGKGSQQGREALAHNFALAAQDVATSVANGVISASKGMAEIQNLLAKELQALGSPVKLSDIKAIGAASAQQLVGFAQSGSADQSSSGIGHRATGGRVPGAVGPDNWTLVDPYGRPAAKVGGGELLIANRHTENALSAATMAVYGKTAGQMVAGEQRPHSAPGYATGGVVPGYATGGNVWNVRASAEAASSGSGWTELSTNGNAAAVSGHARTATGQGGWDFATLGRTYPHGTMLKIRSGGRSGTFPLTDVGDGSSFAPAIGLTPAVQSALGGMPATVDISMADGSNINLASGFGHLVSGKGGFAAGGASTGTNWVDIRAPKAHGTGGAMTAVVQAAIQKATAAANAYGRKHAPAPTITGGGGGAGPVFSPTKGPLPTQVQWALQAANHLADRHPPYGHDGAGWGLGAYDCSSYVSTVMDAAGIWPKWVYYTAAQPINDHTLPGPGKYITIGTWGSSGQQAHTMMEIDGHFFESGGGDGGPHRDSGWSMRFDQYRHPRGFATGGHVGAALDKWAKRGNPGIGRDGYQPSQAEAEAIQRKRRHSGKPAAFETGGNVQWAGEFANGGSFTTTGPTMGLFGEAGPETVIAIPHGTHTKIGSSAFAAGIRHAQNVTPPRSPSARHQKGTSSSKTHSTGSRSNTLDASAKAALHEDSLDNQEARALVAYNHYSESLGLNAAKHQTGTQGHSSGSRGYFDLNHHWVKGTYKWHPSTLHYVGGITPKEKNHLNQLWRAYYELKAQDVKGDKGEKAALATVDDIPPQDRIAGIGTADIEAALKIATDEANNFRKKLDSQVGPKHKHKKPTPAEEKEMKVLDGRQTKLTQMLKSANNYIGQFNSIEQALTNLGTYQDLAGNSPTRNAFGFDPGMADLPKAGTWKSHTWAEWKAIREYWEHKHQSMLDTATKDVNRIIGKERHPNLTEVGWFQQLVGAQGQGMTDQAALDATIDTGPSIDDYISQLSKGDINDLAGNPEFTGDPTAAAMLQHLVYDYSGAQGQVVPDIPGTPAREDILSMAPEAAAAKNLMTFYGDVLGHAKADPKVNTNWGLMTSVQDAFNSAQSTWQGIDSQINQSQSASGPSQGSLTDTARASMLLNYGSNISGNVMDTGGSGMAASIGSGIAGVPALGPGGGDGAGIAASIASGANIASALSPGGAASPLGTGPGSPQRNATPGDGGKTVIQHITFTSHPDDAHTWAQAAAWEAGAAA